VDEGRAVPEARLESTDAGLVPSGEGWFVLNAREGRWLHGERRPASTAFEGEPPFAQVGVRLLSLAPGEPIGMYHWEADQEDFLVPAGEALLLVEGEERPLRQWDFVHCPPGTRHMIVGAGDERCVVFALGARAHRGTPGWGGYPVDELALRHGAGVAEETNDPALAYAHLPAREPAAYREDWLPG